MKLYVSDAFNLFEGSAERVILITDASPEEVRSTLNAYAPDEVGEKISELARHLQAAVILDYPTAAPYALCLALENPEVEAYWIIPERGGWEVIPAEERVSELLKITGEEDVAPEP